MTSTALGSTLGPILNCRGQVQGNSFLAFGISVLLILSSGGKSGAPSIQTDVQFAIALQALLKRDKTKTQVAVEFDIESMEGFRIKQMVCIFLKILCVACIHVLQLPPSVEQGVATGEDELAYGTRVSLSVL